MQLTVARVLRAQGLHGEVVIDLRTDAPEQRLAAGTVLATVPPDAGPLTVARVRSQGDRWVLALLEVTDRNAAEAIRGVELVIEAAGSTETDAWYLHELVGLRAELPDGTVVGEVIGLEHLPAQDLLVIMDTAGRRALVPLVVQLVPEVDLAGRRVVIDPPPGLLPGSDTVLDDED